MPSRVMLEMSLAMWSKSFSSATSASSWYLFSRHNLHRRVNADSLSETTDITPPSNSNHSRADDLDMRLSTSGMSLDNERSTDAVRGQPLSSSMKCPVFTRSSCVLRIVSRMRG